MQLRIERYFVPEEALREALLNALCHKQYQSGVPIQISVYEDKLYIANCGCLPENWTLENLMSKHASSPYNPNIAHVFYLAGFIESWGRGIEKICSACEKDGVPQPEYTIKSSRQPRHSFHIIFAAKGLSTAPHRTGRAIFPHPALQVIFGCQPQISVVRCGSLT